MAKAGMFLPLLPPPGSADPAAATPMGSAATGKSLSAIAVTNVDKRMAGHCYFETGIVLKKSRNY